jgi:pyrroline-5-carboxylate reductase
MKDLISFGAGNMAQALIPPLAVDFKVKAYTPTKTRAKELARLTNGDVLESLDSLDADVYFVCCKPQQFDELASQLKNKLSRDALVVSLLAGTTLKTIKEKLNHQKVLRLMPNTPSQFGHGVTLFYSDQQYTDFIELLKKSNLMVEMNSEDQLDRVTAITGSGPAYLFEFGRIFYNALLEMEIDAHAAKEMVAELFLGSATMMKEREQDFETLREQVTSKGGVTYEALKVFKEAGLSDITNKALKANYLRSQELSQS